MYEQVEKTPEKSSQSLANTVSQGQYSNAPTFRFVDNRPEAIQMRRLRDLAKNSPRVAQLRAFQDMANDSQSANKAEQKQATADNNPTQTGCVQMQQKGEHQKAEAKKSELKAASGNVTDEDKKKAKKSVESVVETAYAKGSKPGAPFVPKPSGADSTIKGLSNRVYEDARQDRGRNEREGGAASASSQKVKDGHRYRTTVSTTQLEARLAQQYAQERAAKEQKENQKIREEITQLKAND